jgi:hypothetical protein
MPKVQNQNSKIVRVLSSIVGRRECLAMQIDDPIPNYYELDHQGASTSIHDSRQY